MVLGKHVVEENFQQLFSDFPTYIVTHQMGGGKQTNK